MLTQASRLDVMNRLGRAMADPSRSRILLQLLDEPRYPGDLARDLELTRSNVSNHLACLRDCGIVVARPEGRQMRYEISDPHLRAALTALMDVTLAVDEDAPCIEPGCHVCAAPQARTQMPDASTTPQVRTQMPGTTTTPQARTRMPGAAADEHTAQPLPEPTS